MNRVTLLGALLIAVAPGFAHKVRVDFNQAIHFSCYKTYSWAPSGNDQSPLPAFPSPLVDQRIAAYIEEAMAARGLKRVQSGGDLRVNYNIVVTEQPEYITWTDGFPGWGYAGWGWGGGFATTTFIPYYEGT